MVAKSYIFVSSRTSKARAEKLKRHIESFGMVSAKIVQKDLVYEIWAKPSKLGLAYIGTLKSKAFTSYLKIVQYGNDGEVI